MCTTHLNTPAVWGPVMADEIILFLVRMCGQNCQSYLADADFLDNINVKTHALLQRLESEQYRQPGFLKAACNIMDVTCGKLH